MSRTRLWLDQQLRGDQPLFCLLSALEALARVLEIGTAVLAVSVEEELVKTVVEIVMVRDVAARSPRRVGAERPPRKEPDALENAHRHRPRTRAGSTQDDREEIVDRPALDDEAPVHEQLAHAELWIDDRAAFRTGVREAHAHLLAGAVSENPLCAARRHDRESAAIDEARKNSRKDLFHDNIPANWPAQPPIVPRGTAEGVPCNVSMDALEYAKDWRI
jgi:hypothetical protein